MHFARSCIKMNRTRNFATFVSNSLDYLKFKKDRESLHKRGHDEPDAPGKCSEGEDALKKLIDNAKSPTSQGKNVDEIKNIVTAENLCSCRDPILMAFEVNCTLQKLADTYTENNEYLKKLADQTEDFAVQLIDQVTAKEEVVIQDLPEHVDRYASMLSGMTDDAIVHSQKKFVAHPLLHKRLNMRWNLGLPEVLKPRGKFRSLLFLLILIDTVLTPLLLPVIGYASYRDQKKRRKVLDKKTENRELKPLNDRRSDLHQDILGKSQRSNDRRSDLHQDILDKYLSFFNTPLVIFVKDKLSQAVFIALHVRVCILASTVYPRLEEYLILVFFTGMVLSECQQYKASPLKYFKDMWNYIDVFTLVIYLLIVILRILTFTRGGDPYHNRLLEVANYFYGANTMLLVLRFSSVLELNAVVGPLQLALFRMLIDLVVILVQFFFVIIAFSLAITKSYIAEMSYMTSLKNQTGDLAKYNAYCKQGEIRCLLKTSWQLVLSVFDQADLQKLESHTSFTTNVVAALYVIFLVLSVIMLINMLVALLNHTYDNVKTNAEVEWKFARAVIENQYRNLHSTAVPFNLISVPLQLLYCKVKGDSRKEDADNRREEYRSFYKDSLFPTLTKRYRKKYGGSFPLSIEEKIDLIMEKLQISPGCDALTNQDECYLSASMYRTDSTSVDFPLPRSENPSICYTEMSSIA